MLIFYNKQHLLFQLETSYEVLIYEEKTRAAKSVHRQKIVPQVIAASKEAEQKVALHKVALQEVAAPKGSSNKRYRQQKVAASKDSSHKVYWAPKYSGSKIYRLQNI